MGPKLKFAEGEKVLCFHGPLIYEAKCLKGSVNKEKLVRYLIHYAGWNKNWDEWVPESRVLKYNDVNVQKQKEVQKAHSSQPAAKTKKSTKAKKPEAAADESVPTTPTGKEAEISLVTPKTTKASKENTDSGSEQSKKKRGRFDQTIEPEDTVKTEISIIIPDEIKQILIDDWYAIVKLQKLPNIPAKISITQIFNNYIEHANSTSMDNSTAAEGLKDYFNVALSKQLLYENEYSHYKSSITDNSCNLCDFYGPVHLLRLFTKLGSMLANIEIAEKSQQFLISFIDNFFQYILANKSDFCDDYVSK